MLVVESRWLTIFIYKYLSIYLNILHCLYEIFPNVKEKKYRKSMLLIPCSHSRASLVAQLVKNLPVVRETWIQSFGWEDPLEKGKATHSSILACRNAMNCIIRGVSKRRTRLRDSHFTSHRITEMQWVEPSPGSAFFFNVYLFIWLCQVLVAACGIFHCSIWDLVSWPGIEARLPTLGAQSLSRWTTREIPGSAFIDKKNVLWTHFFLNFLRATINKGPWNN